MPSETFDLSNGLGEVFGELRFVTEAHKPGDFLTIFEEYAARNARNSVLAGDFRVGICVELGDFDFVFKLFGQAFQDWGEHAARATPFCPKINENIAFGLCHFLCERGIGYDYWHNNCPPSSIIRRRARCVHPERLPRQTLVFKLRFGFLGEGGFA